MKWHSQPTLFLLSDAFCVKQDIQQEHNLRQDF